MISYILQGVNLAFILLALLFLWKTYRQHIRHKNNMCVISIYNDSVRYTSNELRAAKEFLINIDAESHYIETAYKLLEIREAYLKNKAAQRWR